MSGDVSHTVVNDDEAALSERLARSRTVPEFTMQAVTSETGVPGHTIRSWQRRYGFPASSRNESNFRMFSRQDIEAVTWVRDQTGRGQGTREAIAMLRRIAQTAPAPASGITPSPSVVPPEQSLSDALLAGDLDAAQRAWDRFAIAVSPDALCNDLILPAHRRIWGDDGEPGKRLAADAFLMRKAVTLLDQSSPERGSRDVMMLTNGDTAADIPALALATVLSRSGFRLTLPIMDIRNAESIIVMQQLDPAIQGIFVAPGGRNGIRHLLPNREVFHWWYAAPETTSGSTLPPSLYDVAKALSEPG